MTHFLYSFLERCCHIGLFRSGILNFNLISLVTRLEYFYKFLAKDG